MDNINQNNTKVLNQTKEAIELIFNDLDSISLNFNLNPSVISKYKALLQKEEGSFEDYDALNNIQNLLTPPVNSKPYIQSIYVYFDNPKRNFLVSNEGFVRMDNYIDRNWYNSFITSSEEINSWIETRSIKQYDFEKENTNIISIYKKLYSPGVSKADGVIVMNIKKSYIDSIQYGLLTFPNQVALILDNKDRVVSGINYNSDIQEADIKAINKNPSKFFEYKTPKKSYMVSQVQSGRYDLKYISIIPRNALYQLPIQLLYITILLLFISLLLGLIITFFITRKNYRNLLNIISTFESAEKGMPLPELPSRVNDEYSFILQNVIKTFIEQSYLKVQLSEKKYRLKTMEFVALQSQINPHFLFNTLKTIFWKSISLTGDQNEVSMMIEHLSGILHYSLGNYEKTVTLEEEIKNTQSYIEIQKVRYKDKFRVIWQYDDSITQHKVLKLLFQPIIENCIYHGIKEKEGFSYIKIKIALVEAAIRITIIDNGLGMKPDILAKVRQRLAENGEYSEHIGLSNTNKRLKLAYGDEYGIMIRSRFGLGTVIYITIPVFNQEES
jgi:Predicted signal transduction protein with a C-terminal ATPase domain